MDLAYRHALGGGRKLSLTLQWVSWISSCWNMYAVTKQNNSDISGKPTVTRHSLRNDSARYTELLLLPTLFSSILAAPLNILAFVREADGHGSSKSGSRSDDCATRTHAAPRAGSLDDPRRRSAYHGIPLGQREDRGLTSRPWIEIARWSQRSFRAGTPGENTGDPNCESEGGHADVAKPPSINPRADNQGFIARRRGRGGEERRCRSQRDSRGHLLPPGPRDGTRYIGG